MDKQRLKSLDILRGAAILLVFLNHIEPRVSPAVSSLHGATGFIFWHIKQIGWTGVDLFFVISGFLISGLLFNELEATGRLNWWRFWIRRGFKIWPSYLLLLLVLAITGTTKYIDYQTPLTILRSLGMHLLFLQNYISTGNPNGPTWSLAIEEYFYILLPLVLTGAAWLAARSGRSWNRYIPGLTLIVVLVCLSLRILKVNSGTLADADYSRTHFRIDALMIGVYLNYLLRSQSNIVRWIGAHRWAALLVAGILIFPAFFFNRIHPYMFTIGFPLLSVGYSIVLLLVYQGLLQPIETNPLLTGVSKVGLWSYNIYLWHYFVVLLPLPFYGAFSQMLAARVHNTGLLIASQAGLFIATSVFIGAVLTWLVENPCLKIRNRMFPSESRITRPSLVKPA